mgnify:CR=1 FL=1
MSNKKNITVIKTSKATEPVIVNQVIVKAPQRKVYDVGDWRNALRSADSGRVKSLYDLFDDVLIDGLLADAISKRIEAVLNSELTFLDKDGKEVEEIAAIMDTTDWEELLRQIMNERIYGRSGVEFIYTPDGFHVAPIPPKHINLYNKCIVINDTDEKGIPYEGDSSLLVLGHERNYGLLLKATPYAIYKRGGFGDWSQWVELFGMPQRVGKYNAYDPESRKLLEQAMEQAGSAPYIIIPKEAEVETKEAGNGNGTSYNEFRQACNEEMLITILGQTLTTVQGENGARSLGEVHKEVEEGKNRSDMRFVQRVLNNQVLPMLEARGYPVSGGKFVFPQSAEQLSVSDIVQLSDILPIPQSYLHEKYSIPVPDNDEPIARRQAPTFEPTDIEGLEVSTQQETKPKTKAQLSDHSLLKRLRDFFAQAPTMMGANSKSQSLTNLSDDTLDNRLIKRVANGTASYFDAELFEYLSKDFLNAIHTAFKRPVNNADYVYDNIDPAFVTAMEQNLFHFSAAKTLAEVQKLNQLYRKAKTFEEFSREAAKVCNKFNKVWQKTEYDTANLTAESAANYQRLIKKANRFPYWQYVTAGDEKVREEHKKLDGVTMYWDDPRWDKIYPPNGWKCRCRVKPLLRNEANESIVQASQQTVDEFFGSVEWSNSVASHFDHNPGKRQHVFNANQMYVKKFPNKATKLMDKVTPDDWGLKHSYKQLVRDATKKINWYEGKAADWWNLHKKVVESEEVLPIEDFSNRTWHMDKKSFDEHTTDTKKKRAFRTKYLDTINEVMKEPDEVWLNKDPDMDQTEDNELNQWLYVKYYEGVAIVCVCKLQNQQMNFKTWYELHDDKVRKGLLIYRKK